MMFTKSTLCRLSYKKHPVKVFFMMIVACIFILKLKKKDKIIEDSTFPMDNIEIVQLDPVNVHYGVGPKDWNDEWYCNVECVTDIPCMYKDEVDFRIIVMTFNRNESVKKCLDSIMALETEGSRISVEIWVDRSKEGIIDQDTVTVAKNFKQEWMYKQRKGRACVHFHTKNAFIRLQWINTWRPKKNTKEFALILEDDVSISPFAYKWLKATHEYFYEDSNIAGYTLQMEGIHFFAPIPLNGGNLVPMQADEKESIFLYPVLGTWGYAPHPKSWRKFQDWYHTVRPNLDISTDLLKPHIPGTVVDDWYHHFERHGTQESMWEMWHIKFTHDYGHFTVYSNLVKMTGRDNVYLSTNRKERGLHYSGESIEDNSDKLLQKWDVSYTEFPSKKDLVHFNYDGSECSNTCCFTVQCAKRSWWQGIFK